MLRRDSTGEVWGAGKSLGEPGAEGLQQMPLPGGGLGTWDWQGEVEFSFMPNMFNKS